MIFFSSTNHSAILPLGELPVNISSSELVNALEKKKKSEDIKSKTFFKFVDYSKPTDPRFSMNTKQNK